MGATLQSLFRQTAFERLSGRGECCEIVLVVPGRAVRTAEVGRAIFREMEREHEWSDAFTARVIEIEESNRNCAWNRFVHEFSSLEARVLVTMAPNILLHHRDAIINLVTTLENARQVEAASSTRCAEVGFRDKRTFWERLALIATASWTGRDAWDFDEALWAGRTEIVRRLYLPSGLDAGTGRFLARALTTDVLQRKPNAARIAFPRRALHIVLDAVGPHSLLEQREREMLGRVAAYVLIDYLASRSARERGVLPETIRSHDAADPRWLATLVTAHVQRRRFLGYLRFGYWRMCVGRWRLNRLAQLPECCVGVVLTFIAGVRAHRLLRAAGQMRNTTAADETQVSFPHLGAR